MGTAPRIARVVTKLKLGQEEGDVAYWQAQSPETRLAALEEIRREYHRWKYGGEPPFRKVVTIIDKDGEVIRRWGEVEPQEAEITVSSIDETAYLLRSEANSLRLREAITNIDAGTDLVDPPET